MNSQNNFRRSYTSLSDLDIIIVISFQMQILTDIDEDIVLRNLYGIFFIIPSFDIRLDWFNNHIKLDSYLPCSSDVSLGISPLNYCMLLIDSMYCMKLWCVYLWLVHSDCGYVQNIICDITVPMIMFYKIGRVSVLTDIGVYFFHWHPSSMFVLFIEKLCVIFFLLNVSRV